MNYRELTLRLRRLDCEFDRQAKGDPEIWINLSSHRRTTIPNWGSRDLRPGTIKAVLRDMGIDRETFEKA
ncbi:MAG: type II toxin-antitoxin system HicA family toxin [Chloroflexi bacterium]|nr:type II toxin-antitoxin system HicA family toxin [Chloroflexota bacterium]